MGKFLKPFTNDKEILKNEILTLYCKNNNKITRKMFEKQSQFSLQSIDATFKSWHNALIYCDIPTKSKRISPSDVTQDEILEDVKSIIKKYNNTTRNFYLKHGKYSKYIFESVIGNWSTVLSKLDIKINQPKNVSKDKISKDILEYSKNKPYFSRVQFNKDLYGQKTIEKHFGSFSNMLKELNIRKPHGNRINDNEIIDSLKSIYNTYGMISTELIDKYCVVSFPTVMTRFNCNMIGLYEMLEIPMEYYYGTSKFSKYILTIVNEILNDKAILEFTFDWLINPTTKKHLKIDGYYPNYKLAIEVDGLQHDEFIEYFHKNKKEFIYGKYLDELKDNLLKSHNINIVRIKSTDSIEIIYQKLESFKL